MSGRTLATIATLVVSIGSVGQQPTTVPPYEVAEAYRVYSALLPNETPYRYATGTLVFRQETVSDEPVSRACLTAEAADKFKDAVADYERANAKQWLLQSKFPIEKRYQLVSADAIKAFFAKRYPRDPGNFDLQAENWKEFFKQYPDSVGYIIMSAVGFNADKTQAIVYMGNSCSGLCGHWMFHLLEKVDGKWQETQGVGCVTAS